jgi:putative sigma-54 modulation protein
MKVDFTGRGFDITDRVRDFTSGKLEKLKKHLDDIHGVDVVLSVEKYRNKAEIKFLSQKKGFHGTEETPDMFSSIDKVIDKLETQVRKHKQKIASRKRNTNETIRVNVLSMPERRDETPRSDRDIRIIHTDHTAVKPMNLEEAVDELEKFNLEFIIYRNSETDRINLVYQRKDGNIGFIEPGN